MSLFSAAIAYNPPFLRVENSIVVRLLSYSCTTIHAIVVQLWSYSRTTIGVIVVQL